MITKIEKNRKIDKKITVIFSNRCNQVLSSRTKNGKELKNKSQSILGYALLIAIVVAALLAMSVYMKRRIQGSYKKSADVFGQEEQYQPFGGTSEQRTGSGSQWISSEVVVPEE